MAMEKYLECLLGFLDDIDMFVKSHPGPVKNKLLVLQDVARCKGATLLGTGRDDFLLSIIHQG